MFKHQDNNVLYQIKQIWVIITHLKSWVTVATGWKFK